MTRISELAFCCLVGLAAVIGCGGPSLEGGKPSVAVNSPAGTSKTAEQKIESVREPDSTPAETTAEIKKTETVTTETTAVATVADPSSPATPAPTAKEEPAKKLPLFVDWPKPEFVFVFSGQQQGFLEPCGCTGLANQKGGVARRMTFLSELKQKGWPVVPLDVGNHVRKRGIQQEIKFERSVEALRTMGYQAATLGVEDLTLDPGRIVGVFADAEGKPNLFVSANVAVISRELTPEYRVIEAGGKKIGVTSVLGDSFFKLLKEDDVLRVPAIEGLTAVVKKMTAEKCDLYVLLAHATLDETAAYAAKFPEFQIVATAGGIGEPPLDFEEIPNTKTKQIQVGAKGMFLMAVGVFADAKQPFRVQRVPLDDRYEDAPKMRTLMAAYQTELRSLGFAGLGLKEQPHITGHRFVGSKVCGDCHTKAFEIWEKTPHAHATESIINPLERGDVPRHFDPECLSCHVTGWEPQQMYPFATGYLSIEKTPLMKQNGCENCHGPGGKHVQVESGTLKATDQEREELREKLRLPLAGDKAKNKCTECHDIDNSPEFHTPGAFEKYWKKVEHKGKD